MLSLRCWHIAYLEMTFLRSQRWYFIIFTLIAIKWQFTLRRGHIQLLCRLLDMRASAAQSQGCHSRQHGGDSNSRACHLLCRNCLSHWTRHWQSIEVKAGRLNATIQRLQFIVQPIAILKQCLAPFIDSIDAYCARLPWHAWPLTVIERRLVDWYDNNIVAHELCEQSANPLAFLIELLILISDIGTWDLLKPEPKPWSNDLMYCRPFRLLGEIISKKLHHLRDSEMSEAYWNYSTSNCIYDDRVLGQGYNSLCSGLVLLQPIHITDFNTEKLADMLWLHVLQLGLTLSLGLHQQSNTFIL